MIGQSLAHEYGHEKNSTLALLNAIPEDKLTWKPHDKSFTLGELAQHMAEAAGWGAKTVQEDVYNITPEEMGVKQPESKQAVIDLFTSGADEYIAAVGGASDEELFTMWSMNGPDGTQMMTMPRIACLRSFIHNHLYHHRGQLTVYLRLLDVPLPQVYGPTADNPEMMPPS